MKRLWNAKRPRALLLCTALLAGVLVLGTGAARTNAPIGAEAAQAKALEHAGLTAGQATVYKCTLDRDDGRQVYEVEFYTDSLAAYEYEIDALSGAVLSVDWDNGPHHHAAAASTAAALIGTDEAQRIALAQVAGAGASDVVKVKLDEDDGRWEYEVTIVYGTMEYEYELDALSGAVLAWDSESIYD